MEFSNQRPREVDGALVEANPLAIISGGGIVNNANAGKDAEADSVKTVSGDFFRITLR